MAVLSSKAEATVEPIVYIVDDDDRMRESLLDLFMATHKEVSAFASGAEFLEAADTGRPGCIVLDLQMPNSSGLAIQKELATSGSRMPVIFLTGHADVPSSVTALKAGAVDFILKPFAPRNLLEAVDKAIELDDERHRVLNEHNRLYALADTLTRREREVMFLIVSGLMNKQVAYELGICEMTVKLHRMNVMRKMESRSLADLVRKVQKLHDGHEMTTV
ncbi:MULTISPECIES: response regulator [unclassified Rhizobium]|uniref:response regulator transcription factor n=1 Tax=unclassified Rhizobium TaxID=2613769 RepID=UPI00160D6C7A|nr:MULTISPECIES: response regulator [unclassified Rhizobium]MBB3545115.1 FixJ family two-component response regulator [Rhizobium sp. BK399]MCS4095968.1 FixJ family two-component response regulator [Rhizobium sp. BK176]